MRRCNPFPSQFDLAAPFQTIRAKPGSRVRKDVCRIGIVVSEHEVKRQHGANLDDIGTCQVAAVDDRLGTARLQSFDRDLRSINSVVCVGENADLQYGLDPDVWWDLGINTVAGASRRFRMFGGHRFGARRGSAV